MGLLDSVLGSVLGGGQQQGGAGALMQIVAGMLANQGQSGGAAGALGGLGGLAGLAAQFQRSGMGDVMNSWIGKGDNMPISADQLSQVLGGDMIGKITQATGMSQGDLLGQLSQMLPSMVDKLTPDGQVPQAGLGDIGSILGKFMQSR